MSEEINKIVNQKNESNVDVSVIIPCKNEVNNIKWTLDSFIESRNSLNVEIIVVDDASTDGSTEVLKACKNKHKYKDVIIMNTNKIGAAAARNSGAKIARGKYLFFFDAHVKVPDMWADELVNTLEKFNAGLVASCITDISNTSLAGYGLKWNNKLKVDWYLNKPMEGTEIPIAGGAALGIRKDVFEKINGFDRIFQVWGKEDEEICIKAWLYGYKIVINPNVKVSHLFRRSHPYKVTTFNITYNSICLACSHFNLERLKKVIHRARGGVYFKDAVSEINKNSKLIINQRNKYFEERKYDDDFFFDKFNIPF